MQTPSDFHQAPLPPICPHCKRCPPDKRRSMGYIPRPPNAFMLFRADFVRQEHVPGSINAGEKGEEFAAAVRDLDSAREGSPGVWLFVHHNNTSSSMIYNKSTQVVERSVAERLLSCVRVARAESTTGSRVPSPHATCSGLVLVLWRVSTQFVSD